MPFVGIVGAGHGCVVVVVAVRVVEVGAGGRRGAIVVGGRGRGSGGGAVVDVVDVVVVGTAGIGMPCSFSVWISWLIRLRLLCASVRSEDTWPLSRALSFA